MCVPKYIGFASRDSVRPVAYGWMLGVFMVIHEEGVPDYYIKIDTNVIIKLHAIDWFNLNYFWSKDG